MVHTLKHNKIALHGRMDPKGGVDKEEKDLIKVTKGKGVAKL